MNQVCGNSRREEAWLQAELEKARKSSSGSSYKNFSRSGRSEKNDLLYCEELNS